VVGLGVDDVANLAMLVVAAATKYLDWAVAEVGLESETGAVGIW
jgi:hypothetical protein